MYELSLGIISLFAVSSVFRICSRGKIRNEGRKKLERLLVAYGNVDLMDLYNLGSVKYCFVRWSNLGIHILTYNQC
jgi:hypothetical protein